MTSTHTAATSTSSVNSDACDTAKCDKKSLPESNESYVCAICMESLDSNKNFARTNCNHSFCLTCLMQALKHKNNCPICRSNIEDEHPPQSVKALEFETGLSIARSEIQMFPMSNYVDALQLYSNPRPLMMNMLKIFSVSLIHSIIDYQQDNEEGDYEEDEEDEEDGDAYVV
jgi:hypothetical protein